MPNTHLITEVVQAMYDKLKNASDPTDDMALPFQDVWYGDMQKVPRFPAVAVEPGPLARTLSGAPDRTDNEITVYLLVYAARIDDVQNNARQAVELGETLMDFVHSDIQLGGLVIHGYVRSIEPGYAMRGNTLIRTARVTWVGISKTRLQGA